jgi:predicted dehydrogenase
MHLLICGLGSIGRRHLRHFRDLGVNRIDAYRTGLATLPDAGQPAPDRLFYDLQKALAEKPDAVIISSPTSLHIEQALLAVKAGCHVLIEKPLSHSFEGLQDLRSAAKQAGRIVSIAQNVRYHPVIKTLRQWIQGSAPLGEIQMLRVHCGSFLPDWHPWERYAQSYAARAELGGGCRRTHIHELDYSIWLMGAVTNVHVLESRKHPLKTDVDEMTVFILRHQNGSLTTVSLSLAEAPASRTISGAFEQGIFSADLISGGWVARRRDGSIAGEMLPNGFQFDQTYREQAIDFLRAVRGETEPLVGLQEAASILKVALSLEEQHE